ncbi:membrane-spanning 4-domains subfamily A member 12-like isoform X2 [Tupaia chinensis]|nr:membrane-spanning 4-domains subfamily A member 12-like isoform X2 [Tupaia chinensis]
MIGFIYIGFGTILGLMNHVSEDIGNFASRTFIAGYPFWSGISFIISGSLSIPASPTNSFPLVLGKGISAMLMIFSLLEFFIAYATWIFVIGSNQD